MDKIKVVEVFTGYDGFFLLCDYFDDSIIDERLEAGRWIFSDDVFSVGTPTSCFAPPKHRIIHIRTQNDLSAVKEVIFRYKEIEEYDWFEGVYVAAPKYLGLNPLPKYDIAALHSYAKEQGKSISGLSEDEIERFRIEDEK